MTKLLKKVLPRSIRKKFKDFLHWFHWSADLKTSQRYSHIGSCGPLITDIFCKIKDIPGSFNIDDCAHFHLILSLQTVFGLKGDLFEIGSFHGRSTAVMARYLADGECIHVCDAFQLETEDYYDGKTSPAELLKNILAVNPHLTKQRIVVYKCLSSNLLLDGRLKFRFIHIDGGHSKEQTLFDLNLCQEHVVDKGIIIIDDYHHKNWPGVTPAVDLFLKESQKFTVMADLNRHGAKGRKIYLIKKAGEPAEIKG
ncbi:MAG: class I SAM-dependent methyltransferase [Patescibacteria group bacterium]|jgi:hypothetical protein